MKDDKDKREVRLRLIIPDTASRLELPLAQSTVPAGFPSPADDFEEVPLDLNKYLVRHPAATFYARVSGDSMKGDCIEDGDLLVVDKAIKPCDGCIAVCWMDGGFTLKHVKLEKDHAYLVAANDKYKPIRVDADNDFIIWGVVRFSIREH